MSQSPLPSDPVILRSRISYWISHCCGLNRAEAEAGRLAVKHHPDLSPEQLTMRRTVLRMAAQLSEKELESAMDELVAHWLAYRKVKP